MALLLSAREPIRYQPPGSAQTYLLRAPTPYSWAALTRAVRAYGAVQHSAWDMARVAKEGLAALLAGPDDAATRDRLAADVDAYTAALAVLVSEQSAPPGAPEEFTRCHARFGEVAAEVRRGWPAFAKLEADNAYYAELQAIEGLRLHLIGWDGGLKMPAGTVPEDALDTIPPRDLYGLWARIAELRAPTETERKNSGSPLPGSAVETISPSPDANAGP